MSAQPDNMETEWAPIVYHDPVTPVGPGNLTAAAMVNLRAAMMWRKAMRTHALLWRCGTGAQQRAFALNSARVCRRKSIEATRAAVEAQSQSAIANRQGGAV